VSYGACVVQGGIEVVVPELVAFVLTLVLADDGLNLLGRHCISP
jgi:hypothetical protein